ncbi:MAG: chorismate-binding protein [Formosimonas sp.]
MRPLNHCFALLFNAATADAVSRLFTGARRVWVVGGTEPDAVALLHAALRDIDAASRAGAHVVLSLSYESLAAFDGVASGKPSNTPWLQAIEFAPPQLLNRTEALAWLSEQAGSACVHLSPAQPLLDEAQFVAQVERIRELIAAGETYQVNYTFPLQGELLAHATGDAALAATYRQLVDGLKIPYGALLALPHNSLLSCSPELFFELSPTAITCRPMKGTAAVADNDVENTRRAAALAADPKNRAENLMIVDLMRNDVSRLPQVRQVSVPKLFEVKRYGAVLQMTSTVKAHLREQPSLYELFAALFPCGSITGAPKRRTMAIIEQLEPHARGAYCGAIGYIAPAPAGQGALQTTFSVPIRTLETTAQPVTDALNIQHWPLRLSVGAGITYDSVAADEWQESLLKARFLTRHTQPFELIETLRVERGGVMPLLAQHMARMQRSAAALGWVIASLDFSDEITAALHAMPHEADFVGLRLGLQADGTRSATMRLPTPLGERVPFAIHTTRTDSSNPFLQHKTTARALYNSAMREAAQRGLFDYVFCNEKGELTEGARSNIFIRLDGQWLTPPLSSGVLAGVQRAQLLTQLPARERVLTLADLNRAEAVLLSNALYGALPAFISP